ncbi:hypothetical protein [Hyphomicrobium sp.]|uniref:hypothetical protein n=1 Tax=Hyphomicrobium sp. TaxID=82 RepID=UPI000FA9C55F|nr:hypothetical protein [Hyphomicrobium sp.]RUP09082.1 MAG: hypothetical protein EKK38_10600 [Hyphomicrobium sp.]
MNEENDVMSRVESKLDVLIRLTALSLVANVPSLKEKAIILSRAGLAPKEIAALCDSTPNTVSVALSAAKREKKN